MTLLATLTLGLVLGLKHALDADHLVAVSTIVSLARSPWRSLWIGLFWGIGHTFSLLLVGLVVLGLKQEVPAPVGLSLECLVGVMLIGLGIVTVFDGWRKKLHAHTHVHRDGVHTHFHIHRDTETHHHTHPEKVGIRPLLVGLVHGLAGSAALMLLVVATLPSPTLGLLYIVVFGGGSIIGMAVMSYLMGLAFVFTAGRLTAFDHGLRMAAGTLSTAFGVWVVVEVGFLQGLFF